MSVTPSSHVHETMRSLLGLEMGLGMTGTCTRLLPPNDESLGLPDRMLSSGYQLPSQSFFLHRHQRHLSTWLLLRDNVHLPDANSCSISASGYISLIEHLSHGHPRFNSSRVQPLSHFFTVSPLEPSRCPTLLQLVLSSRRKPLQHSPLCRIT